MKQKTFIESFGHIVDTPDGIERIRRLILDLAMRGWLSDQPSNDREPVTELLARMNGECARKVAKKEIRRPRPIAELKPQELPHEIPETWRWIRIGQLGAVVGGGTPSAGESSNFDEAGIPWVTPADMKQGRMRSISRGSRSLSAKGYASCSSTLMPAGSLVFSSRAPIGYVAVAANELCTNQGCKSLVPHVMECSPFFYWALRAFAPAIERLGSGTTFKEVSGAVMESVPLPLPPLEEQKRIVEEIDSLMDLCDRLEREQARAQSLAQSLGKSVIAHALGSGTE